MLTQALVPAGARGSARTAVPADTAAAAASLFDLVPAAAPPRRRGTTDDGFAGAFQTALAARAPQAPPPPASASAPAPQTQGVSRVGEATTATPASRPTESPNTNTPAEVSDRGQPSQTQGATATAASDTSTQADASAAPQTTTAPVADTGTPATTPVADAAASVADHTALPGAAGSVKSAETPAQTAAAAPVVATSSTTNAATAAAATGTPKQGSDVPASATVSVVNSSTAFPATSAVPVPQETEPPAVTKTSAADAPAKTPAADAPASAAPATKTPFLEQLFVRLEQGQVTTNNVQVSVTQLSLAISEDSTSPSLELAAAPTAATGNTPVGVASVNLSQEARPTTAAHATPIAEQISHAILTHAEVVRSEGRVDFHLHLDPPELGGVRVQLTLTQQTLSARLVVHEAASRQLVQSQIESLRQRLQEMGISVGHFDVAGGGSGKQDGNGGWPRQRLPFSFDDGPGGRGAPPTPTTAAERVGVSLTRVDVMV